MNTSQILDRQREFFRSHHTIVLETRRQALLDLSASIQKNEKAIQQALFQDLGKAPAESTMTEISQVYDEIRTMLQHMERWSSSRPAYTPVGLQPSLSSVQPIPYGNTLIISPWNYPFALCLIPLVDALAAGNTAVIKPSEYSIHTSAIIEKVISEAFDPEYVTVVQGAAQETQDLLAQDFDFIFFTGSENVGKIVMEKAAAHLTPVVLELGGKSPAIVDVESNLAMAARRIVFGKFVNAGQTCVAPDYVLVDERIKDDFIRLLKHQIELQYPAESIGKIISQRHFDRLSSLLAQSKILYGGTASKDTLQIAPSLVECSSFDEPIMQEEIFGPILPILTYSDFFDMMEELQKQPTPLASYLFSDDELKKSYWREVLPFGGGCINDTIMQVANNHIPFGGMKQSGMGQYHGLYGFETFSHYKGIVEKYGAELPVRYTTFDERLKEWILHFLYRAPKK